MGPKINEPARIPMGKTETSMPLFNPCDSNFVVSDGRIDPRVINVMPKRKRPIHAAAKTRLRLYIIGIYKLFTLLMQDRQLHTGQLQFPAPNPQVLLVEY